MMGKIMKEREWKIPVKEEMVSIMEEVELGGPPLQMCLEGSRERYC